MTTSTGKWQVLGQQVIMAATWLPVSVQTKFQAYFAKPDATTVGGIISGDRSAYAYLNQSMKHFVSRKEYEAICADEGFRVTHAEELTLGIASLVVAEAV
jgi:ubiquinone/menaquinone biosynthesis C-methylase UbiE